MNCLVSSQVLDLYLDGELAPSESIEVLGHLEHCASCRETYWRSEELHRDIRQQVKRYAAPPRLRQNIQAALRRDAVEKTPRRQSNWNWMAVAASILLFASLSWNITLIRSRPSVDDRVAKEVLSSHLRSMVGTHLLDVPSSDQHTVKPWFNGKLNFSPDVKDFTSQGFPLVGGRIEYLDDRPVAALVYQRRQHFINLFIWPSASTSQNSYRELKLSGYNLTSWTDNGMNCWAISDLQSSELEQFAQLYR